MASISEKIWFSARSFGISPAARMYSFELVFRTFRYAHLFNQRLLNRLL